MILYDSRPANSSSPRIRRAKTPFARLCSFDGQAPICASRQYRSGPCRQLSPATRLPSCAQNFFARSLVNVRATLAYLSYVRSCLSTPSTAAERLTARPVPARPDHAGALRQPPVCRHAPKIFFAQSLVNARSSLVRALLPINPSIRRKRASSAARAPPPRQPCCAQNFLPNLTQSLVISRRTLVHLSCLSTPSTAATKLPI